MDTPHAKQDINRKILTSINERLTRRKCVERREMYDMRVHM